jgi:hypothetical protein
VTAAPSVAPGPRRLSVLGLGRIFIYRNAGGPNTVEPACGANAQKLAVLLVDCDGHALRQGGAVACRDLRRFELVQSSSVVFRYEFEYLLGIRLGFAGDDRRGDARGLRQGRQEQRKDCNKSMIVHSSLYPKQHFQNWSVFRRK